jgi:hypothetical protein
MGATMFQLLSRRLVHEGAAGHSAVIIAATRAAPPLRTVAPNIPAPLAQVVDRALSFDRAARWPNARAMRKALLEACPELATPGATESLGAATEPEDSRRLRAAAAAGASQRPKPAPAPAFGELGNGVHSRIRPSYRTYWPLLLLLVTWGVLLAGAFSAWRWLREKHDARAAGSAASALPSAR